MDGWHQLGCCSAHLKKIMSLRHLQRHKNRIAREFYLVFEKTPCSLAMRRLLYIYYKTCALILIRHVVVYYFFSDKKLVTPEKHKNIVHQ